MFKCSNVGRSKFLYVFKAALNGPLRERDRAAIGTWPDHANAPSARVEYGRPRRVIPN
jgi:hypothetical protein